MPFISRRRHAGRTAGHWAQGAARASRRALHGRRHTVWCCCQRGRCPALGALQRRWPRCMRWRARCRGGHASDAAAPAARRPSCATTAGSRARRPSILCTTSAATARRTIRACCEAPRAAAPRGAPCEALGRGSPRHCAGDAPTASCRRRTGDDLQTVAWRARRVRPRAPRNISREGYGGERRSRAAARRLRCVEQLP